MANKTEPPGTPRPANLNPLELFGNCQDLNFDPLVLPPGVEASDDPIPFARFNVLSRLLHWSMALLILAMLFIGVGMVSTLSPRYHGLLAIHKPLGVLILILAAVRLLNRILNPPPPLPSDLPSWQKSLAKASHVLLYSLMFALPLIGWSMLSAAGYPIVLFGSVQLPAIVPNNVALFAVLRSGHSVLAGLLFATFLAHLGAATTCFEAWRDVQIVIGRLTAGRIPYG